MSFFSNAQYFIIPLMSIGLLFVVGKKKGNDLEKYQDNFDILRDGKTKISQISVIEVFEKRPYDEYEDKFKEDLLRQLAGMRDTKMDIVQFEAFMKGRIGKAYTGIKL